MKNNNQILMKEKLGFFGIIKESLKIYTRSPSFIILTFIASLPLFCFLVFQEHAIQQILNQAAKDLTYEPPCEQSGDFCIYSVPQPTDVIKQMIQDVYQRLLLVGLLYLVIGNILDLFSTVTMVHSASVLYAEQEASNLKGMLCNPFRKLGFKGPWMTSIYALVLSTLTLTGFPSLAMHFALEIHFAMTKGILFFGVLLGLAWIALLIKYMEWSAIWNMGMVISVLENKHGDVALGVSAYISRGSRKRGLLLMLLFLVWKAVLRLSCLYIGWNRGINGVLVGITAGHISLICLGNAMKWAVFTVYYYDCKKRFLEKKVDVEQGNGAENTAK